MNEIPTDVAEMVVDVYTACVKEYGVFQVTPAVAMARAIMAEREVRLKEREGLTRALGNMLMLNAVRQAATEHAPLWLEDADAVLAAVTTPITKETVK